jgi:membrane protein implicated in regulation of membrane protease activity
VVGLLSFVLDLSLPAETGIFGVLSVALVAAAHYWFPGAAASSHSRLNQRTDQLVGKAAVVQDMFVNGQGAVTLGDTRWSAQSNDGSDLPAGTRVTVVSAESTLLIVRRS